MTRNYLPGKVRVIQTEEGPVLDMIIASTGQHYRTGDVELSPSPSGGGVAVDVAPGGIGYARIVQQFLVRGDSVEVPYKDGTSPESLRQILLKASKRRECPAWAKEILGKCLENLAQSSMPKTGGLAPAHRPL